MNVEICNKNDHTYLSRSYPKLSAKLSFCLNKLRLKRLNCGIQDINIRYFLYWISDKRIYQFVTATESEKSFG